MEPYSRCKAASLADFGLGTNSQLMDVDTSNPTRIGWRTATPAAIPAFAAAVRSLLAEFEGLIDEVVLVGLGLILEVCEDDVAVAVVDVVELELELAPTIAACKELGGGRPGTTSVVGLSQLALPLESAPQQYHLLLT